MANLQGQPSKGHCGEEGRGRGEGGGGGEREGDSIQCIKLAYLFFFVSGVYPQNFECLCMGSPCPLYPSPTYQKEFR